MENKKQSFSLLHIIQDIHGDKVVLMIFLLLIAISVLTISSSTSLLARMNNTSRIHIIWTQVGTISLGLCLTLGIYKFLTINFLKKLSKYAFIICLCFLLFLILHLRIGNILRASVINNSKRIIYFFGFQLNVFEIVKLGMVMYMAWAVDAYKSKQLKLPGFIKNNFVKATKWENGIIRAIYFYMPMLVSCILIVGGSMFSALFIGAICYLIFIITGINLKETILIACIGLGFLLGCIGIYKITDGKYLLHIGSAINRIEGKYEKKIEEVKNTPKFRSVLDKVQQPISARIAISEGGFFGKGPGKSTQRYIVPIMYEDFMFDFIIEEYGLFGAFFILIFYTTLISRGSIICNNCDSVFAKTAVAGLVILISGQAMLHIMINVGILPLSGQTLPLISHGKFSFFIFSIAFGVLLSISKIAKENIEKQTNMTEPIIPQNHN